MKKWICISYGKNILIFLYNGDIFNKLVLRYYVNDVIIVLILVFCLVGLIDICVFFCVFLVCVFIVICDGGVVC